MYQWKEEKTEVGTFAQSVATGPKRVTHSKQESEREPVRRQTFLIYRVSVH